MKEDEIIIGSQWKHALLNEEQKGPNQPPNVFRVTKVEDGWISVVQSTRKITETPEAPTLWDSESFLETFEPL